MTSNLNFLEVPSLMSCVDSSIQVFFLENDEQHSGLSDPADHSRLTENVAKAFCLALCPHLKLLKEDGMTKLGLRVTLDSDQVSLQWFGFNWGVVLVHSPEWEYTTLARRMLKCQYQMLIRCCWLLFGVLGHLLEPMPSLN